jgi:hypothetical protein
MKYKVCINRELLDINYTINVLAVNEPGVQYQCDPCACDLTHTIRIKCADPVCDTDEGVDICPPCFCEGKEFGKHKRGHPYRVIVRLMRPSYLRPYLPKPCRKSTLIQYLRKIGEQMSKFLSCVMV